MSPACRRTPIACALVAAVALLPAPPVRAQLRTSLSPQDVRAAIALGNSGEPAPYPLHHRSFDPAKENPVVVGVVYTPFVRIALAAKAGRVTAADLARRR